MSIKYRNRHGDIFTFTKDQDGNVLWEGDFKYCRLGCSNIDENIIDMVDPSGGPYMGAEGDLGILDEEFAGLIIERFERIDTGYKIIVKH